MNRKEKVQKIQDIMKMTYNSDVPTFLMLSLIGVVMGLVMITIPLQRPGTEMAAWFGALVISVSVFALMIRLHLLRRSFEKLGENLFDLQYALSRTEMTRFPDLEALSNKFYANIKEKRLLEQQLPADDEDANFDEINGRVQLLAAFVKQAKYDFWAVYNWYSVFGLKLPSDKIGDFRTTTKSTVSA